MLQPDPTGIRSAAERPGDRRYSNDCLDNCEHPAVVAAMVSAARAFDTGSEGMRNISGNNHLRLRFEAERRLHRDSGPVDISQDVLLRQAASFPSSASISH